MLTSQMPALTRAMSGVLPPLALKQLTQALGNCNQEVTHRGQVSFAPDGWQNAQNNNGLYTDLPPTAGQYNQFYNDIASGGNGVNNNVNNVNNNSYNNNSYNTNNEFITQIFQGGPPGRDGRDGLDGLIGRDGINGSDGERGAAGDAGPAGPPGSPGAAGGNGRDGRDGADGQAGRDGQAGAAGQPGAPGAAGPGGRDGRDGRGVDSLKEKPFVSTLKTDMTPVVTAVTPEEFQVVVGVTFDDSTCQLQLATATVRGIKSVTNSRAVESIREIPGIAYGP